jgi:methionyl-tRNA formyltransferase
MRIVFFGTPVFAAKILEYLIENKVDIVAVVTQADRPRNNVPAVKLMSLKKIQMWPL